LKHTTIEPKSIYLPVLTLVLGVDNNVAFLPRSSPLFDSRFVWRRLGDLKTNSRIFSSRQGLSRERDSGVVGERRYPCTHADHPASPQGRPASARQVADRSALGHGLSTTLPQKEPPLVHLAMIVSRIGAKQHADRNSFQSCP
jgi:hypothetical protein